MSQSTLSRAQNTWTEDQRTVLRLLHTEFAVDDPTLARLFNHIFDGHLKTCGITGGLAASVLDSQYRDRTRPTRSHLWRSAVRPPATDAERARRNDLTERIRQAAAALGLSLGLPAIPAKDVGADGGDEESHDDTKPKGWKGYALASGEETSRLEENQRKNVFAVGDSALIQTVPRVRTAKSHASSDLSLPSRAADQHAKASNQDTGVIGTVVNQIAAEDAEMDDEDDENGTVEYGQDDSETEEVTSPDQRFPTKIPLDMLHWSEVDWKGGRPSMKAPPTINHASAVYQRGGQVHRVRTLENQQADFMVCDTAFCTTCNEEADPTSVSASRSLPFIHSIDTIRDQGMTNFIPETKQHTGAVEQCYLRYVRFQSLNHGVISCWAMVCGYVGCDVCSGSRKRRRRDAS